MQVSEKPSQIHHKININVIYVKKEVSRLSEDWLFNFVNLENNIHSFIFLGKNINLS